MEIVPQVHLIPETRGANVYLIAETTLTVVDPGLPHNAGAILRYLARLGRRAEDLTLIILTHHHLDHAGSTAELQTRTGAEVLVHAGDAEAVARRRQGVQPGFEGPRGLVDQLLERLKAPEQITLAAPLEEGQVLQVLGGLVIVHTPGHTPGSVCLYAPKRGLIFVGDMVINNVSRLSRPLPTYGSAPEVYESSLQRLASLDFEVCLFGHGPPILQAGSRRLQEVAERGRPPFPLWRALRNLGTLFSFARRLPKRRKEDD